MIKNFFFYGCFLFLLAISVVSCRNEYDAVIQNEKPQTYTVVHNNTTQVNQNATLSAKLNSFRQGSENSKNSSYLDAYEIFETQVTYVKNNDKDRESYAFYIKDKNLPTDKFHVKNLVFSKLSSETIYSVKLVSYYLPDGINENSKNILVENVEVLNPETGLPNKNVNGKSAGCGAEVIEIEHWCGAHLHYGAGAAADCHDDDKPYSTWIVLLGNCDGGGQGGGSGDHNDGPANPGGPGGGTGSGGNGGNPVDTGLSLPPTCQSGDCDVILANKINDILGSVLNYDELLWLVDNDFTAQAIYTSLLNNNTQSNKDYISVRISLLVNGLDITNAEFQSWVLNPTLSTSLFQELIIDWRNPTIVKPTARFKNNAKLNSIYNQAKNAANFKQYLQNFEPTFSVAHLKFDVGVVVNPNALAETKEPISYWIDITFNNAYDYANTPKVIIAYAFMHEMIHAEMFRKLLSISSTPQGNINWAEVKNLLNTHNYPGLFDYYTRYLASDANLDHSIMGAHYITIIVNYLKQIYGNKFTDIEYKTIAWSGLRESKAWKLLPTSERQLYLNTWNSNYWLWEK